MAGSPWDGFLVGPENALAHSGAVALARGDASVASPLVVHGPAGSGKTRILDGLVAEKIARFPGASVATLTAEAFASLCHEAAGRLGGFADLRERFRGLDLFVLDDLHALERSPIASEELAHTLDALEEAGGSAAFSARVGPGRMTGWPPRLVSRLVGGLSLRVEPPGLATRRRFALETARARSLSLSAEAVEAIAEGAAGYREIDGRLARLALAAKVERRPADQSLADSLAEDDPSETARQAVETIARLVAERFGVSVRDLRSASRRQAVVVPRHLAIHLARTRTGLSFASLGALFGKRDAKTVRHACAAALERLAADPSLAAEVAALLPEVEE